MLYQKLHFTLYNTGDCCSNPQCRQEIVDAFKAEFQRLDIDPHGDPANPGLSATKVMNNIRTFQWQVAWQPTDDGDPYYYCADENCIHSQSNRSESLKGRLLYEFYGVHLNILKLKGLCLGCNISKGDKESKRGPHFEDHGEWKLVEWTQSKKHQL